jgi:hypothetical protein
VKPVPNPKYSVATVFNAARNMFAQKISRNPRRKPSPRKLEPHEVVARLKNRRAS